MGNRSTASDTTDTSICEETLSFPLLHIPEGPLLCVAAMVDLDSCIAFNAVDSAFQRSTEDATRSLARAIAHARQEQRATTAAIEQERLEARRRQTAEGTAWAQALAILEPHRDRFERLGMNNQVAQLFGMLQQGPEPQQ